METSVNLDIMKTVTQQEVNKACHSRSYAQIDDMLGRVRLELILAEEVLEQTEQPTRQQLFHIKVIKSNIDRLERRAKDLVDRNARRADKMKEQKQKLDMALAIIKGKAEEKNIAQRLTDAKNRVTEEDLRNLDPGLIQYKKMWEAGLSWDDQVAILKEKEKLITDYKVGDIDKERKTNSALGVDPDVTPVIETLFEPNADGEPPEL